MESCRMYCRQLQAKQANRCWMPAPDFRMKDKGMPGPRFIKTERPDSSLDHNNIEPFTILKATEDGAYELDLPK